MDIPESLHQFFNNPYVTKAASICFLFIVIVKSLQKASFKLAKDNSAKNKFKNL